MATCDTSQVLLAGVPGGFSEDFPVYAHLLIGTCCKKGNKQLLIKFVREIKQRNRVS